MTTYRNKSDLSPARRHLLELLQNINFGRIERLRIRGGEPVLVPAPRVVRDIKLGGENGPRPESASHDFALKSALVELFEQLDELGDDTVEVIEVKHGLPLLMRVADD